MANAAVFRTMLFVQWKLQRAELLGLTLVAAVIPPIATWPGLDDGPDLVSALVRMVDTGTMIAPGGALLALSLGALLAMRPFMLDARVRHTYALALPVRRSTYALMRAASGIALCLIPAVGFLIGALVAAEAIPDSMWVRKYPAALAVRFLLATATAFAVFFGIQYGLGNRARRWLLIVGLTVVATEILAQALFRISMVGPTIELLSGSFSPVRLFIDRWKLFDV
jgi:hypothetical protein